MTLIVAERLGSPMISIFLVGVLPARARQTCKSNAYDDVRDEAD